MTETTVEQKSGGDFTWLFALVAVASVVGLMMWLFSTRELVTTAAVAPDAAADSAAVADATVEATDLALIGATPDQYVGQEVTVNGVPVAAVLGDRGFWAEIAGANPFLMVVDPAVADVSWLAANDTVSSLSGTVQPVTEEIVNGWVEGEVIRPGASAEASFATHYLAVGQARP